MIFFLNIYQAQKCRNLEIVIQEFIALQYMPKNQRRKQQIVAALIAVMDKRYQKPVVIIASVVLLNIIFGFDPKFTIINLIWLLPLDTK